MKIKNWLFPFVFLFGCVPQHPERGVTNGIYGDPGVLLNKGYSLTELGVTSLFVHKGSITTELIENAHQQNIKVYAEFPLLNGKEFLENDSSAWPIDSNGNRSPKADWFMGICPSNPDFKKYREEQLLTLLSAFKVDGVWLDYVHWHAQFETPAPILPETCFCEYCLEDFSTYSKLTLPEGDTPAKASWILTEHDQLWRQWRSDVVIGWIKNFRKMVHDHNPLLKLGVYYCPWYPDDFNRAGYRILGLDISRLYKEVDVLSPMLYHGRMGRNPEWVGEYLEWFQHEVIDKQGQGAAIWPIVQASDEPERISPEEFRDVMIKGMSGPSSGITMFSTWAFQDDSLKIEVMRDLYKHRFTKKK